MFLWMGPTMTSDGERVHRAIARAGVASRRAAERLVVEGRVTINGEPATIGQRVTGSDVVAVDGEQLTEERETIILMNKRRGVISSVSDPGGRPTVVDTLPADVRLYPVGRLDQDSTGALLLTNDGDLAHRLMHPRHGMTKQYEALLDGQLNESTLRRLRRGVELDDGVTTRPAGVDRMSRRAKGATWLRFTLSEGRNRQIRRMGEAVGHRVLRLHRPSYAELEVRGMEPGEWRELTADEARGLIARAGLDR